MRNGRVQASYVYDDGKRYYATHTYDNRTDAEGWLANERKLIELGEWSPPESRARSKAISGVQLAISVGQLIPAALFQFFRSETAWVLVNDRSTGYWPTARHGIASAHAICPSKPSVLAMSR
jgi:hypothetical protein